MYFAPVVITALLLLAPWTAPLFSTIMSEKVLSSRGMTLWFESGITKVLRFSSPENETPVWDSQENTIHINAARGEYEAFQAVISAPSSDEPVVFEIDDFIGQTGLLLEKRNIDVYQAKYIADTIWPDPMVPLNTTVIPTMGENTPIYVCIYVPVDTACGSYFSNFTIFPMTPGEKRVPIVLNVWNFTLPATPNLRTWFDESPSSYHTVYGLGYRSTEHTELIKNVWRQFKKFKITPGNCGLGWPDREDVTISNGITSVDFSVSDPMLEFYLEDMGFRNFRFPLGGYLPRRVDRMPGSGHPDEIYYWNAPPYTVNPNYDDHIGQYIKLVGDHYRERGWLDKAYTYVTDEPIAFNNEVTSIWNHPPYKVVREYYNLTHRNVPELKYINTVQIAPQLYNYTEVWAVPGGYYHELDAESRRQGGQEVWWYNTDAGIANIGTKGRSLYWDTYARGVDAALYWGINYWTYHTINNDPWQGSTSNGDGYLFYPGAPVGITDDVVPTVRLILARDGLEDYDYLCAYAQKKGVEAARALAESAAKGSQFAGQRYQEIEDYLVYELREYIANEIVASSISPGSTWFNDTFDESDSVQSDPPMMEHDGAWEGNWKLSPAHPPVSLDVCNDLGGWHSIDQETMFSDPVIDTSISTEGPGSLRVDTWRNDDPGIVGGYGGYERNIRNGRVITSDLPMDNWSQFDILQMDVRSDEIPPGILYMLIGDAEGTVIGSGLHPYMRYSAACKSWNQVVVDISNSPRGAVSYIEPVLLNIHLEYPWHRYSYWLDNITLVKSGYANSGTITSKVIDTKDSMIWGELHHTSQFHLPPGTALTFQTRSSNDNSTWSSWTNTTHIARFKDGINSPSGRFFQWQAKLTSEGEFTPVLSDIGFFATPVREADLSIQNLSTSEDVPNQGENFLVNMTINNPSPAYLHGISISLLDGAASNGKRLGEEIIGIPPLSKEVVSFQCSLDPGIHYLFGLLEGPSYLMDPDLDNNEITCELTVNALPIPAIICRTTGGRLECLEFNGSTSRDDGDILSYRWDFGDGTSDHGPVTEHVFGSTGTYSVVLDITDDNGAKNLTSKTIHILNRTLKADLEIYPETGDVRTAFRLAAVIENPDDLLANMSWDLGDGEMRSGETVEHRYSDDGKYNISLHIAYEDGGRREIRINRTIMVLNLPPTPTINLSVNRVEKGGYVGFDASETTDPDDPVESLEFKWDFGDGNSAIGSMSTHVYAYPGTFTVKLTVTDDDGAKSTATAEVVMYNQLPVPVIEGPSLVIINTIVSYNARGSYDPDGRIVDYRWTLPDNGTEEMVTIARKFLNTGTYNISLTVTDEDGGRAVSHLLIEVIGEDVAGNKSKESIRSRSWFVFLALFFFFIIVTYIVWRRRRDAGCKEQKTPIEEDLLIGDEGASSRWKDISMKYGDIDRPEEKKDMTVQSTDQKANIGIGKEKKKKRRMLLEKKKKELRERRRQRAERRGLIHADDGGKEEDTLEDVEIWGISEMGKGIYEETESRDKDGPIEPKLLDEETPVRTVEFSSGRDSGEDREELESPYEAHEAPSLGGEDGGVNVEFVVEETSEMAFDMTEDDAEGEAGRYSEPFEELDFDIIEDEYTIYA